MANIVATTTITRKPQNGKDAPTITVSASCHNGSSNQFGMSYVEINGERITSGIYYTLDWNGTSYDRTVHNGTLPYYMVGFIFYYIDAETLKLREVDLYDTYNATESQREMMYARMFGTADYFKREAMPTILVVVASDASSCEQSMRDMLTKYGSSLTETYVMQRRRHFFVTNLLTAKTGQAYEEISDDPTQKIVKFNVNVGEGVILQGSTGENGKQGTTFSIRKWKDVGVGDSFRVESSENGVLISDIVIYEEIIDGASVVSKWICKKAFTISSTGDYTKDKTTPKEGSRYWNKFGNYFNVATDLVLADKAIIENLLLNNMSAYPKNEDGTWDTEHPTISIDGNTGEVMLSNVRYSDNYAHVIHTMKAHSGGGVMEVNLGTCYLLTRGYLMRLNSMTANSYFVPKGEIGQVIIAVSDKITKPRVLLGNFRTEAYSCSQIVLGQSSSVTLAKVEHGGTMDSGHYYEEWTIISRSGSVTTGDYKDADNNTVNWWYYD